MSKILSASFSSTVQCNITVTAYDIWTPASAIRHPNKVKWSKGSGSFFFDYTVSYPLSDVVRIMDLDSPSTINITHNAWWKRLTIYVESFADLYPVCQSLVPL